MKTLILSLALTAFAVVAAQADNTDAKAPAAAQHSCCAKTKAAQPASASCCAKTEAAKPVSASCCSKGKQTTVKKTVVKQALLSPKAAAAL